MLYCDDTSTITTSIVAIDTVSSNKFLPYSH